MIFKNARLYLVFKAINNTASSNGLGLILTFFIFGAYLCIIMDLPSSLLK